MKPTESLDVARRKADAATGDPQEKNRVWWETLPMTYADWESPERRIETEEHFRKYLEQFRTCSDYLERFPFGSFAGKKVLEIGCGFGAASVLFARSGAEMTAVDLTAAAIEGTKAIAKFHGLKIDARQMDAQKLEFDEAAFDYVFSWGVLHHSHDSEAAFREVSRVLRPGGRGMIMVYNRHSFRYWHFGLQELLLRGGLFRGESLKSAQRFYTDGYYHRHFSPRELRTCLGAAGLRVDRTVITYMNEQMFYKWPRAVDDFFKDKIGWLLVAEFTKL